MTYRKFKCQLVEVQKYGGILESCCPSFSSSAFELDDSLWKLTGEGDTRYNRFISQPVQCCVNCDAGLTVQNAPSCAIVFEGTGPFPMTKITLECHNWNTKYGVGYFSNESGKHLYLEKFQSYLVEASTVTYMDKNLYKWIPSFTKVSQCYSFLLYSILYLKIFDEKRDKKMFKSESRCKEFAIEGKGSSNGNKVFFLSFKIFLGITAGCHSVVSLKPTILKILRTIAHA